MNRCSGCGYIVPGAWTECRRCGTPVGSVPIAGRAATLARLNGLATLPPPPSVPTPASFGAPDDALIAGARPRGVVPDTMLPAIKPLVALAPPKATARINSRTIAIVAIVIAIVGAGVYSLLPRGGHAKQPPTILAPLANSAGLPTGVSDVVRVAAESARHTALTTVMQNAGASAVPLSVAQLEAAEPSYKWVPGSEPSTSSTVISITSGSGIAVIAVSGTNRDICAFGRWGPVFGTEYVTMAHLPLCSATNAPTTGWTRPGGGLPG